MALPALPSALPAGPTGEGGKGKGGGARKLSPRARAKRLAELEAERARAAELAELAEPLRTAAASADDLLVVIRGLPARQEIEQLTRDAKVHVLLVAPKRLDHGVSTVAERRIELPPHDPLARWRCVCILGQLSQSLCRCIKAVGADV